MDAAKVAESIVNVLGDTVSKESVKHIQECVVLQLKTVEAMSTLLPHLFGGSKERVDQVLERYTMTCLSSVQTASRQVLQLPAGEEPAPTPVPVPVVQDVKKEAQPTPMPTSAPETAARELDMSSSEDSPSPSRSASTAPSQLSLHERPRTRTRTPSPIRSESPVLAQRTRSSRPQHIQRSLPPTKFGESILEEEEDEEEGEEEEDEEPEVSEAAIIDERRQQRHSLPLSQPPRPRQRQLTQVGTLPRRRSSRLASMVSRSYDFSAVDREASPSASPSLQTSEHVSEGEQPDIPDCPPAPARSVAAPSSSSSFSSKMYSRVTTRVAKPSARERRLSATSMSMSASSASSSTARVRSRLAKLSLDSGVPSRGPSASRTLLKRGPNKIKYRRSDIGVLSRSMDWSNTDNQDDQAWAAMTLPTSNKPRKRVADVSASTTRFDRARANRERIEQEKRLRLLKLREKARKNDQTRKERSARTPRKAVSSSTASSNSTTPCSEQENIPEPSPSKSVRQSPNQNKNKSKPQGQKSMLVESQSAITPSPVSLDRSSSSSSLKASPKPRPKLRRVESSFIRNVEALQESSYDEVFATRTRLSTERSPKPKPQSKATSDPEE